MKYKINDWVWFRFESRAYKGKITAISDDHRFFVISGGNCNLAVLHVRIISHVDPKDIPTEPPTNTGLFARIAIAIDNATRGGSKV